MVSLASIAHLPERLAHAARRHPAVPRAAAAWVPLLVFAYFVPPRGWLAVTSAYLLLTVALIWTIVPIFRALGARLAPEPTRGPGRQLARRQGIVLAVLIVGNLVLVAAHLWSPWLAGVAIITLGIEEAWAWVVASRR